MSGTMLYPFWQNLSSPRSVYRTPIPWPGGTLLITGSLHLHSSARRRLMVNIIRFF